MRRAAWVVGLACVCVAVGVAMAAGEKPIEPTAKITLFNGKDFAGWVKFCPNKKADVDKMWTVRDGVIHCIGKPHGYIRTEESYTNYKLHFEWRWPAKPTNSGCLLHKTGPEKVWPRMIEAQLMHKNAGDFWIIGGTTLKVRGAVKKGHAPKNGPSNEKPAGEWNAYDIVCDGAAIKLYVNGKLMNEGIEASDTAGNICLQSEGSPIEFRNITLEPLTK